MMGSLPDFFFRFCPCIQKSIFQSQLFSANKIEGQGPFYPLVPFLMHLYPLYPPLIKTQKRSNPLAMASATYSSSSTRLLLRSVSYFMVFFFFFLLLILNKVIDCSPPEDPIKCVSKDTNCTITNSYGTFSDRSICQAANVAYPATEEELIAVVAEATKAKRKIKVATRYSHSMTRLVCPDGKEGLLISTKNLNKVLEIDAESMKMSVQSGVLLRQIINEASKAGLALPYTPYFWGLTIGGLLSTGAHGSTFWGKRSSVHDCVVELTIVTPGPPEHGHVSVRRLDENNSELNAAKLSLGVLGVISKVTLKLEPMFKRSISYVAKNDSDLGDRAASFGLEHEFADITWYPSQQMAVYRIDDRISSNTSGDGLYDFLPFRPTPSHRLAADRAAEESQESLSDAEGKCARARLATTKILTAAYGLTNNGVDFTGYPVIGYQNRIQSYGTCLDSTEDGLITTCSWDPRAKGRFFFQTTINIRLLDVKSFIEDVQKLVKLEPKGLCSVINILMRYVKLSSAYLASDEDAMAFDITYYRSKNPMNPRLFQDILEEIEQIAVFKYEGLPHWGKNRNLAFVGAIKKYKNANEFLRVKQMYDPIGLFSSEWTDQILGLKGEVAIQKEGCALEGLCVCSKDIHCAPNKGYFCRVGKVYKHARVCTLINDNKNDEL